MKEDPTKCVLVVDFTKFGMVDEGNVHCFVVSLLSSGSDESVKSGISSHSKMIFNFVWIIRELETNNSILWLRGSELWEEAYQASFPICKGVIFTILFVVESFSLA